MSNLKKSQINRGVLAGEKQSRVLGNQSCCGDEIDFQQLRNKYKEEALEIKSKIHNRRESNLSRLNKIIKDAADLYHILDHGDMHSPTKTRQEMYSESAAGSTERSESSAGLMPAQKFFRNPNKKRKSNNL